MLTVATNTRLRQSLFLLLIGICLAVLFAEASHAHGMSEAEKQSIIEGGNWRFLWLGATHMLSGYDHLAFVFGIIFFLTTFRDIAKYVTAFTVGHSVTLIYATFNAIQLNYFLIDAVIALSVCYIAFANLDGFRKYLSINPPNMMVMITGLGLIHGFGLSTRLQALPLSEDHLLMNIISFNIGVELGQISALVIMLLLIAAWRHTHFFKTFSLITNYALILLGAYLFLMQMHGYEHVNNPDEFIPISQQTKEIKSEALAQLVEEQRALGWKDSISFELGSKQEQEYKLVMEKGAKLEYFWHTTGDKVFFNMHGEPLEDKTGYSESYGKGNVNQDNGSINTSFKGTHGWYWKNKTRSKVIITLYTRGEYQRP